MQGGSAPATKVELTPANTAAVRQAGAEILFWSQAERDANFPNMETLFPGAVARAGRRVRPMPAGQALAIDADAFMAATNVAGLLVLQDGKIRLERYARGYSRAGRYTSFSVAKSLTSTLVGAAIQDGAITSVDDPVTRYIPELKGSAYDGVSVRQVLTMTSGVKWNEDYTDPNSDVASMYKDAAPVGIDQTVHYLAKLPREAPPGTKWVYKTGETNLIGVLVSKATGKSLAAYAEEKIWRPFGMERDLFWMIRRFGAEYRRLLHLGEPARLCADRRIRAGGRAGWRQARSARRLVRHRDHQAGGNGRSGPRLWLSMVDQRRWHVPGAGHLRGS